MSIQDELNQIKNAVYGADVRDAIHDSIKKTYDDSSANGNANMEVEMARGTEPTLNDRLVKMDDKDAEITTQLAQKVGDGTKAELEDLSSNVLAAMEGGAGTSFNLLSIPQNNSVSEHKTTFIKTTRNLMNPNHLEKGYYIHTGDIQPHEQYYATTDFPRTNGVKKLSFQPNDGSVVVIAFYDATKKFISYVTNEGNSSMTTFEVPDSSYYFNISFSKSILDRFMIEYGETQSSYEHFYSSEIDDHLLTSLIKESKNLMNPTLLGNGYLNNRGTVDEHVSYRYTKNYIPTKDHRWLSFQPNRADVVVNIQFYDLNRNYLVNDTNDLDKENIKRFEVPENAHYFRISFNLSVMDEFMVEYGLHQSDYEAYMEPTFVEPFNNVVANEKEVDLSVVCFGDSILSYDRAPYDVASYIAERTGADVTNVGFGGCRMSSHESHWDAFCMYRLADSITSGNFDLQNQALIDGVDSSVPVGNRLPTYFKEGLNVLKNIDFNEVDYITISYGQNDYTGGKTIDNSSNLYDTKTYKGALRHSLKTILETYPHLKILVTSPLYCFWYDSEGAFLEDGFTKEYNGNTTVDFVNAGKEVSQEIPTVFLDNLHDLGINKFNRTEYFSSTDGIHLTPKGRKRLGHKIGSALISEF